MAVRDVAADWRRAATAADAGDDAGREERALRALLESLAAAHDERAFWAAVRALHGSAVKPGDAPFLLHLLPQPEVLDALARLLRRARPELPADGGPLRLVEAAEVALAHGLPAPCDDAAAGASRAAGAGFGFIPQPQARAVQAYAVSALLHLVGGVEAPPHPAPRCADNALAVALHPRVLVELQQLVEAGLTDGGGAASDDIDVHVALDALLVLALAAPHVDVTGARYAASVVAALGGLDAPHNAANGPAGAAGALHAYAGAARSYYALCAEPLLPLLYRSLGWAALPHGVALCVCQALAELARPPAAHAVVAATLALPAGGHLLEVLTDALLPLPRSLWPEMSSELTEWRRALDEDGGPAAASASSAASSASSASVGDEDGGAASAAQASSSARKRRGSVSGGGASSAASAARGMPPPPLFDPRFDTRQGPRYYDYVALIPPVRERETRLRREMREAAAAAAAAAAEAAGGGSAMAIDGGDEATATTATAPPSELSAPTETATAAAAASHSSSSSSAAVGASSSAASAPSSSSSASMQVDGGPAGAPHTGEAEGAQQQPPLAASPVPSGGPAHAAAAAIAAADGVAPWRLLDLRDLAKDVAQRNRALQRRDAAMLVVAALAANRGAHRALLSAPGLLERLVGTAHTGVGYQETPTLAAGALRQLLAACGDDAVRARLTAAGAPEALVAAQATALNVARRRLLERAGGGASGGGES